MTLVRPLFAAALLYGCGGAPSQPAAPTGMDAGAVMDTGTAATPDAGATPVRDAPSATPVDAGASTDTDTGDDTFCTPTPGTPGPGEACVARVHGVVHDQDDHPLAGLPITFCGPACTYAMTAADGSFTIVAGLRLDPAIYTLQVHGRPDHASLYVPAATLVDGVIDFGAAVRVPVYTDLGPALPDPVRGGSVTAGDVTLTAPPGGDFEYSPEDLELGALGTRLRVATVPMDRAPAGAVTAGVVALWALGPFDMTSTRTLAVSLANRASLPAGAAVDLVGLGNSVYTPPLNGGRWIVVATAHVTADGTAITTDAGQGLTTLTWLGVRAHATR